MSGTSISHDVLRICSDAAADALSNVMYCNIRVLLWPLFNLSFTVWEPRNNSGTDFFNCLKQRACWSRLNNMASRAAPWRYPGWAAADRKHTQSARGETSDQGQRCSGRWLAHYSHRTECPAWSDNAASRGVDHPAPRRPLLWRASDNPADKKENRYNIMNKEVY